MENLSTHLKETTSRISNNENSTDQKGNKPQTDQSISQKRKDLVNEIGEFLEEFCKNSKK